MTHTILAAFLLLATVTPPTLAPNQRIAAEVAAGEVSAQLFTADAYADALCTAINRVATDSFPDTLTGVLAGFYAQPRALSPVEETAAVLAFADGGCDGRPWLYALSAGDVARLGFRDGAQVYTHTLPSGATMQAHFYESSPWGTP